MRVLSDLILLGAMTLIVYGCLLIWIPLAYLVAGGFLFIVAIGMGGRASKGK